MKNDLRFSDVYRRKLWATHGVLSGDGSRVATTRPVAAWLTQQAADGMRDVLDLGCGDLEWVAGIPAIAEGSMRYHGVDAVPSLVSHHKRVYPWFHGAAMDLEAMPRIEADVVLCKDVLFHLCNGAAEQILTHIERGTWRRLLITTQPGAANSRRHGMRGGKMAPLDIEAMGILSGAPAHYLPRPGGLYAVYHREPIPATPTAPRERFWILTRAISPATDALAERLAPLGEVRVIEDRGPEPYGYQMLTTLARVTAWDRAFAELDGERPVWLIEDDVHLGDVDLADLIARATQSGADLCATDIASRTADPDWPHWGRGFDFRHPCKSFNPLCRLSAGLIRQVLAFRELHQRFAFHEILFASLAESHWDMRRECPELFGRYRWRPLIAAPAADRIEHPVKTVET